jgi:energy-coupling factor transport system permease protein
MIWVVAAATAVMMARNPFYVALALIVARTVGLFCARSDAPFSFPLVRVGSIILLLSTLFNMAMVHVGEIILFRLPANWLWIGGPYTVEAGLFGLSNGLALFTLLVVFTTLNTAVSTGELVRLTPRALRDLGVVILIALTYLPETMGQLRRIREAQAIRGHRVRGLRDWQPVLIPLLIGGLERAMGVAEAMVARGYGATADSRQPLAVQLLLLTGLMAVFAGWVLSFWVGWPGWALLGLGSALILALLWQLGRRVPHTHYRPHSWTRWDTGMAATAVFPLIILLIYRDSLPYSPYPVLTWPSFEPIVGISLLFLLFPIFARTESV